MRCPHMYRKLVLCNAQTLMVLGVNLLKEFLLGIAQFLQICTGNPWLPISTIHGGGGQFIEFFSLGNA